MATTKYCLITGCGKGGIGNALAREFVDRGYHVIATVLPNESREHLENDDNITICDLDVTKDDMVEALEAQISAQTKGRLEILVNNAGIVYTMPAVDSDISHAKKVFDVNFFGAMTMVHHFHRQLVAAKGRIINISSIAGVTPHVYGSVYNASKAALVHFMDTLRIELLPFDVKVINVISGEVGTNILRHDRGRSLPADSIYLDLNEEYQAHCNRPTYTCTPQAYAKAVVQEATKQHPKRWFWWGAKTTIVWIFNTFFGLRIWELFFTNEFKLKKLKQQ